uniref:DUF4164 family protein n=1 Tax=Phenylobacterium glaciei TaxID=2803784 RepID=A0A974P4D3_9CAUL|nr:DUF4164 family protein [Phenylobacterium glaciei]
MNRESAGDSALDQAAKRLDRAVAQLEQRLAARAQAGEEPGGLFDQDRAKLADELDKARARERALEDAGAEASAALGRAIAEIQAALADHDGPIPAEENEEV